MLKPQLVVIDTEQGTKDLLVYLKQFDIFAFDTETTGVLSTSEIIGMSFCAEEDKAFYVILHKWDVKTQSLEPVLGRSEPVLDLVRHISINSWVGHNAVFDASIVENYFKIRIIDTCHTDTMILAHLLNENRRVGLKELASEYFGESSTKEQAEMKASVIANGGKLTQKVYEMYKADSRLMAKYGAKDALLTYRLFITLLPELYEQNLDTFFYEDESMPLLRGPTYELNNTGLKVDQPALLTLKKTLEAECIEAKEFIHNEIKTYVQEKYPGTSKKTMFNIGSNQQMSWLLFDKLNLEFGTLTASGKQLCGHLGCKMPYSKGAKRQFIEDVKCAKGNISSPETKVQGKVSRSKKVRDPWCYIAVDKKILAKFAPRFKWIERLLEYQKKTKLLNTYVCGIEERIQYGIIRPSFLQHGTTSGRYSSRNPNFQNLPRDDKRIKACIVARPGKIFVGADYSQLEPRVFAYFSKDSRLLAAFKGQDDFYSVIGMRVYNKTDCHARKDDSPDSFAVKYKKLRDLSKVIALASTYGATAHQLAPTTGKSTDETQEDIDAYFEHFPGVAQMMLDCHHLAKTKGYATNLFGRLRRLPEATTIEKIYGPVEHGALPYQIRNTLNLSVNHVIQSTGASICNRSMITFCALVKEAGIKAKIVCQVHDEIIVECAEADADDVALILKHAMETTVDLNTVALTAEPKSAKNMAELK